MRNKPLQSLNFLKEEPHSLCALVWFIPCVLRSVSFPVCSGAITQQVDISHIYHAANVGFEELFSIRQLNAGSSCLEFQRPFFKSDEVEDIICLCSQNVQLS